MSFRLSKTVREHFVDSQENDDEVMSSISPNSTSTAMMEEAVGDSVLNYSTEPVSFEMLPPPQDLTSIIPFQSFCPVVRLEKLTKKQIYQLTNHRKRKENLRDFIRIQRSRKRDKRRKDMYMKTNKSLKTHIAMKKKEEAVRNFVDFHRSGNDLLRFSSRIDNYIRSIVDIDRYSDTVSVADSEMTRSDRPRRKSLAPVKYTTKDYEPSEKRRKGNNQRVVEKIETTDLEIEYEVEEICQVSLSNQKLMFLIKWENYPSSDNTWEPLRNIRDCQVLDDYLQYELKGNEEIIQKILDDIITEEKPKYENRTKASILDEIKKFDPVEFECNKIVYKAAMDSEGHYTMFKRKFRHQVVINHFKEMLTLQKEAHDKIRAEFMEKELYMFDIYIENNVDYTILEKFNYIRETIIPIELKLKSNSTGCQCTECSVLSSRCCIMTKKSNFGYKLVGDTKRLRLRNKQMIYECNENCSCDKNCLNRVTQQPRTYPLTIFKTNDGRGWGVKAKTAIPRGTFLMEYTGEIIDQEESIRRGEKQDERGQQYMFDLDYTEDVEAIYTIDAANFGNLSRLINHNCEPNCSIWPVTTCNQDPSIYKLCYFTSRPIKAGTELSIDYTGANYDIDENENENDTESSDNAVAGIAGHNISHRHQKKRIECKCGSSKCRGSMFL